MDVDLTLEEAGLFREITGKSAVSALSKIGTQPCQEHRLLMRHCPNCGGRMCPEHKEAFIDCDSCEGMDVPEDVLGALVLIIERRERPEATIEEIRQLPYTAALERLGNAYREPSSTTSTRPGSRPSSTSTRASRRSRTRK